MTETKDALKALVQGVVALSEATRELAASGEPDLLKIANMKARTAEISAFLAKLQPTAEFVIASEVLEPAATSASSRPTQSVGSIDDAF